MCLFISLIFYIIRKNNALETTRKVSCSVIYFFMFAKGKFSCNFSCCFCFSLWSEQLAGEDGCNSGYCFGASESFVSKISVFQNMRFRWFIMSWSSSVQVYNRFTRDFWGYCFRVFFLKTGEVKILVSPLIIFFVPLQKNLLLSIIPLSEVHWLFAQG